MAPVTFFRDSAQPVRPYYVSPWQEEAPSKMPAPVLVSLRGDFFCLPFGGNNDEEFDQIFNPGRRTGARRSAWDNALTRQFAVRSHFRDEADEKARIDFWRSWYEANSAHFPKAP